MLIENTNVSWSLAVCINGSLLFCVDILIKTTVVLN